MTGLQFLTDLDEVAVQAGFWVAVLFPAATSLYWPWWRSWWGRNIIVLEMVIAAALLAPTLQIEFGLKPGHTPGHFLLWTSVVSLCCVPAVLTWRAVLIFFTQRSGRSADS